MHSRELVELEILCDSSMSVCQCILNVIRNQMRHLRHVSLFPFSHSTFPVVRPKPQECVTEVFLWFFFMSRCVWRAYFAVQQAPSLWPNLMPLFGSHCRLFLYRSHDPTRTVHGFNHLDSRGVSPLCPFLPVFLFASLLWVENMLACFHSVCFLFSSQQLRGWRGGILAVCVICSNRRSTGSSSSSILTPLSAVELTMS